MVKLLLEKDGVDINTVGGYGDRTTLVRTKNDRDEVELELLLVKDAVDIDFTNSYPRMQAILGCAAKLGVKEVVKLLQLHVSLS